MKNNSYVPQPPPTRAPAARLSFTARHPRLHGRGLLGAFLSLAFALAAPAATLTVTNTNDSGPGSLRQAIIDVPAGGTINFNLQPTDPGYNAATGMYTITQTSGEYVLTTSLTLIGPGRNVLTVSGNHTNRTFETVQSGPYVFSGITFANGYEAVSQGAGFEGRIAMLQFSDCAFVGNVMTPYGGYGGALSLGGDSTVSNCLFQDNQASISGGIYVQSGNTVVNGCTFVNNTGGDVINEGGSTTVTNSTFSGGSGNFRAIAGFGGAGGLGTMKVIGCTISGNYNGAIYNNLAVMVVSDCTITQNIARVAGAIYNSGSLTLSNSTVTQNSSLRSGGGIYSDRYNGATLTISHSIIAGNSCGVEEGNGVGPDVYGTIVSQGYNLIGDSSRSTGFGATGDLVGTSDAPIDPLLGPLQNNGGPTLTQMPLTGSPVINAGDPSFNLASLPYDQRGYQRVANGRIDIGAVESGSYLNLPPTAVPGNPVSVHDTSKVTLNGSASYDDNTPTASLGYAWQFTSVPAGSHAVLSNANTATPSFTPDLVGSYVVQLIVTDTGFPALASAPQTVLVSSYNQAPTGAASASPQLPLVGQTVTLNSTGTIDPDNDLVSYQWVLTTKPAGSTAVIVSPTAATASIVPDLPGAYSVTLTPSDFLGAGTPATATFTASTTQSYIEQRLREASAIAETLSGNDVSSKGNQKDFVKLLQKALKDAQHGRYSKAIKSVDNAIIRTDGVPLRGTPDLAGNSRDWILKPSAQTAIYSRLTQVRNVLNGMLPDNDDHLEDDGD